MRRIVARHPGVPFWLCVGDIARDGAGPRYESLGASIYWIHGNNDDFDAIAAGELPPDLHHIANGTAIDIRGPGQPGGGHNVTVAGLGGTFAPTWYESRAADLPHPRKRTAKATELADKRRHFLREEVAACTRLHGIDVFMTHEAATPFRALPGGRGPDAGKSQINEVLTAMRPRLHLFGHHHRFSDAMRDGVRSIGLDLVTSSYLLVDAASHEIQVIKSQDR